ncbi:MAG: peroxiredoxin family protein [Fimbriimonadaceae bacterium]
MRIFLVIVVALAGVGLIVGSKWFERPAAEVPKALNPESAIIQPWELHPVTEDMSERAQTLVGLPAPDFTLEDHEGAKHSLSDLIDGKPLLIYFIQRDCPCCISAEPVASALYEAYKDKASVVGVVNADVAGAKDWRDRNEAKFPVLADAGLEVIQSYGAERGVYWALVHPKGQVLKIYPGYSKDVMKEMGASLAALSTVDEVVLNVPDVPQLMTSGCAFPTTPEE